MKKGLQEAYNAGQKLQGQSLEDIIYGDRIPDHYIINAEYNLFFTAGYEGRQMPIWVAGWRYGKLPVLGTSTNYREGQAEAGVSCMEITFDGATVRTADEISALFCEDGRPIIKVAGWLHWKRGGDGEPLLIAAKEI